MHRAIRKEQVSAGPLIGVWSGSVSSDLVYADVGVCECFGLPGSSASNGVSLQALLAGIHEADRQRVLAEMAASAQSGLPFESTYRVESGTDSPRWIKATGRCFFDQDGKPAHYHGVTTALVPISNEVSAHAATIEHLMAARETASAAGEPIVRKLIEAVLIEAGRRLAANLKDDLNGKDCIN